MNENSLSEQNQFKWDDTSIDESPINKRGFDMVLSSEPGAVQSRFQQIFQR